MPTDKFTSQAFRDHLLRLIADDFDFPIVVSKDQEHQVTVSLSLDVVDTIVLALEEYRRIVENDIEKAAPQQRRDWQATADKPEAIRQVFMMLTSVARSGDVGSEYKLLFDGRDDLPPEPN